MTIYQSWTLPDPDETLALVARPGPTEQDVDEVSLVRVVDVESGTITGPLPGAAPSWCR